MVAVFATTLTPAHPRGCKHRNHGTRCENPQSAFRRSTPLTALSLSKGNPQLFCLSSRFEVGDWDLHIKCAGLVFSPFGPDFVRHYS